MEPNHVESVPPVHMPKILEAPSAPLALHTIHHTLVPSNATWTAYPVQPVTIIHTHYHAIPVLTIKSPITIGLILIYVTFLLQVLFPYHNKHKDLANPKLASPVNNLTV